MTYLCRHFGITRSGYYAFCQRGEPKRIKEDNRLLELVKKAFEDSNETYGSPRIHRELREKGTRVAKKRVERLMRDNGLKARSVQVYKRAPEQHHRFMSIKNVRRDAPKQTGLNQQWVADLTYLRLNGKFMFLAVVLDLYSRKIIGWSLGKNKTAKLTKRSIMMAIRNRNPQPGLIFHTDRGAEYHSQIIQAVLKKYQIIPSMNRPGQCTDNAEMESFFHSFKSDEIAGRTFKKESILSKRVKKYMTYFYNRKRRHSSLDYKTPLEYEMMVA